LPKLNNVSPRIAIKNDRNLAIRQMKFTPKYSYNMSTPKYTRNIMSPNPVITTPISFDNSSRNYASPSLYQRRNIIDIAKDRCRFNRKSIIKKYDI